LASALEVFAANDVDAMIDARRGYTPTPVVSHAILTYNKNRTSGLADGVVIESGWFAARPSGTEEVYKIYAESFRSDDHLRRIQREATGAIAHLFTTAKPA
jgi:phosphoglucomutase